MCFITHIDQKLKYKIYNKWPFNKTNLFWKSISKVATEDIVVYKIGYNVLLEKFKSYIQGFVYSKATINSVNLNIEYDKYYMNPCELYIHQGFHSYKIVKIYDTDITSYFYLMPNQVNYTPGKCSSLCLAEFIIPKGARYIMNDINEIVSDKIIFSKIIA